MARAGEVRHLQLSGRYVGRASGRVPAHALVITILRYTPHARRAHVVSPRAQMSSAYIKRAVVRVSMQPTPTLSIILCLPIIPFISIIENQLFKLFKCFGIFPLLFAVYVWVYCKWTLTNQSNQLGVRLDLSIATNWLTNKICKIENTYNTGILGYWCGQETAHMQSHKIPFNIYQQTNQRLLRCYCSCILIVLSW